MRSINLVSATAFALLLSIVPVFGQVDPAKVKIKGVGLDSTYAQVIRALGKPVVDGKGTEEGCIGGLEKTVEYRGLSFYFMDGDSRGGKTFEVKGVEVTAGTWSVSGVKIGDGEVAVRRKFGRRYTVDNDATTGERSWTYAMDEAGDPGAMTIVFKKGKVVSILFGYQVC